MMTKEDRVGAQATDGQEVVAEARLMEMMVTGTTGMMTMRTRKKKRKVQDMVMSTMKMSTSSLAFPGHGFASPGRLDVLKVAPDFHISRGH